MMGWKPRAMQSMTVAKLVVFAGVFIVLFDNGSFFRNVMEVYPLSLKNIGFLGSLAVVLASFIILSLTLLASRYTVKPLLILTFSVSSIAAYFMDNYNTVIDSTMIQSILNTNWKEATELVSIKLLLYFLLLGAAPSVWVYRIHLKPGSFWIEWLSRIKIIAVSTALIIVLVLTFSKFYTSFFREYKPLRYRANPVHFFYSVGKYIRNRYKAEPVRVSPVGVDAMIPATDTDRELVILVIGEAARRDRFSLNGYPRETNPLLKKEDVVSFTNFTACGTSTEVSVPCMFSIYGRSGYTDSKGKATENLLDVLRRTGVNCLWRDNNSDSKGVALRVPYEDYKNPNLNPICDVECRDEGMLEGLQDYIDRQTKGDILIVLHQMGNHGPAYYNRYPKSFEKFTPVCKTNQLNECTAEELNNAYDNAILYTDYFLWKTIQLLKQNSDRFETAMIYLSDHGESLGEKNIYLHGIPYLMAPDVQKNIPVVAWFGDGFKIDRKVLKDKAHTALSQDHLFHTVLGLMEINTSIYDRKMDLLQSDNR